MGVSRVWRRQGRLETKVQAGHRHVSQDSKTDWWQSGKPSPEVLVEVWGLTETQSAIRGARRDGSGAQSQW